MSRKCSFYTYESSAVLENPHSYIEINQYEWGRDIKLHDKTTSNYMTNDTINVIQFECIFGIYELPSGPYIALVVDSEGYINIKAPLVVNIRLAKKIIVAPLVLKMRSLSIAKQSEQTSCIEALQYVFASHKFFYSPTGYDVTLTQQNTLKYELKSDATNVPQWKRSERKFFWNYDVVSDLMTIEAHSWITVFMSGYIEYKPDLEIDDVKFSLLFVSRRSCFRQGCRFTRRGVDAQGNCANYVETEQTLLFASGKITSYVQVRGSIPVVWKSPCTLKYDPVVLITPERPIYSEEHIKSLSDSYCLDKDSAIVCVNLIDKKKDQQRLGIEFATVVESCRKKLLSGSLRYVWFDFHAETKKKGKWSNLSRLLVEVDADFNKIGFFSRSPSGEFTRQKGIIRTNCMDNLDRTNVTQSLFARRSLLLQVGKADATINDKVLDSPFKKFEKVYKAVWADNADLISKLYAGTGALKVDFTRTGKRTIKGMVNDVVNSIKRYYLNNFCDGFKQDAIDISLGKYKPTSCSFGTSNQKKEALHGIIYRVFTLFVFLFTVILVSNRMGFNAFASSNMNTLALVTGMVAVYSAYLFWIVFKYGSDIGDRLVVRPRISLDGY